ncbi:MAG: response regulator [Elusimicrobiota bacterium]
MARKILVVDDDADLRRILRGLLAPFGTVLEAANGLDALGLLRAEAPALMLLDVSMPVMDGLAVLTDALAIDPKLPVVMLTGDMDMHIAKRALEAGARSYITKPFEPSSLCAEVRRLTGVGDAVPDEDEASGRPWRVRR